MEGGGGSPEAPGRTIALIPAYQAAATVGDVVRGVRSMLPTVVVVDDGSSDATAAAARAAGAEVVQHAVNRGKGAALITGLSHLAAAGATHALTLDADGQHLPSEIPALLAASARAARAGGRGAAQGRAHDSRHQPDRQLGGRPAHDLDRRHRAA
jgi:glycosyltransferase involved in cell wall biosynthesis